MTDRWKRGDILLSALVLIIAAVVWLAPPSGTGVLVLILAKDTPETAYPLDTNATVKVMGPYGETVIAIDSGCAFIRSSPCPDRLCLKMGRIRRAGEVLVCVPNQVSVRISGECAQDAISY